MEYCKPILGDKQGNVRLRILQIKRTRVTFCVHVKIASLSLVYRLLSKISNYGDIDQVTAQLPLTVCEGVRWFRPFCSYWSIVCWCPLSNCLSSAVDRAFQSRDPPLGSVCLTVKCLIRLCRPSIGVWKRFCFLVSFPDTIINNP